MQLMRRQIKCRAIFGRQVTEQYGSNMTIAELNGEM